MSNIALTLTIFGLIFGVTGISIWISILYGHLQLYKEEIKEIESYLTYIKEGKIGKCPKCNDIGFIYPPPFPKTGYVPPPQKCNLCAIVILVK